MTIGKVSEEEARAKSAQVDYLLMRLKQRLIELPPGVDIVDFIRLDGKPPCRRLATQVSPNGDLPWPLSATATSTRTGSPSNRRTIEGIELHFKHLLAALGERFPIRELKLADLQGYVDRRAKAKGMNGRRLSPATIKKEIVTPADGLELGRQDGAGLGPVPE